MNWEELFVGLVTASAGIFLFISALSNSQWYFSLPKPQRLEAWLGRTRARVVFGVVGLAFVLLGIAIACGFGPNKHKSPRSTGPQWQAPGL